MGWFGGGGNKGSSPDDVDSSGTATTFDDGTSFGDASLGSGGGGMSLSSGSTDMEQFSMALQQQLIVQQVITALTDTAFTKCVTSSKPSDSLSGSQVSCIHSTVNKWMDTNEFMMGRLAKKQQQRSGGY